MGIPNQMDRLPRGGELVGERSKYLSQHFTEVLERKRDPAKKEV
jgi:hypothetical protein